FIFLWLHISTAKHVFQGSSEARKRVKYIAFLWIMLFLILTLLSVLPDPNRDEFAGTRYAIGMSVVGFFAAVHVMFLRKMPKK
ncbi:MAG: hypothetical protein AAF317_16270, partial [Pseudomonadota bacterium]